MSEIPKHYSLVHEKDDHFMVHDRRDGKAFAISKKQLHPAHQIKLMKMKKYSDGGDVTSDDSSEDQAPTNENLSKMQQLALDSAIPDPSANPLDLSGPTSGFVQQMGQQPEMGVPGATLTAGNGVEQPGMQGSPGLVQGLNTPPPAEVAMNEPQLSMAEPASVGQPQAAPQVAPQAQSGQAPQLGVQGLQGLEGQYGKAVMNEANALSAQNKELARVQEQQNALMQQRQLNFEHSMQSVQNQYNQISDQVMTQKIDPNRYWNSKSTGSKVGAVIGVLLGGIGQGLLGTNSNPAMDVLNKHINEDIDAQKMDLGKKENLLSQNLRVQGSMINAENATRLQYSALFQGQLAAAAARTNSPVIMARAQKLIAQQKMQDMPLMQSLAADSARKQLIQQISNPNSNMGQYDPAVLVAHVVPREHQAKVFSEIEAAQNTAKNAPEILKSFDNAANTTNAVDFVPGMQNAYQKSLHALLGPTFKDVEGTVRQAAMDNMFQNITPQFGDSANTIKTKRDALRNYLNSKEAAPTAKGYGIDLSKFNSTSTNPMMHLAPQEKQYAQWAMANPNNPKAQIVLKKLGLK